MADFSLTTLFVLSPGNILPVAGSTENLTGSQWGVFRNDYSVATVGNIAASKYIYLAQNRLENIPDVGTKRSDKINNLKVKSWYKVVAEPDVPTQTTIASDFSVSCGEEIWVTIRAHSNYIETGFFNGLTQSVSVLAPCCDCGEDPCADIDAADIQALIDEAVAKFQVQGAGSQMPIQTPPFNRVISNYIQVYREGTGAASTMVFQGIPLPADAISCADFSLNPWMYDRLWFQVFVTKAPPTTQDYETFDRCDQVATITVTNRNLFPTGSSNEIAWLEKYYYSYQSPAFKALVRENGWNGAYTSYVVDGTFYDTYYIEFLNYDERNTWDNTLPQDERVIIAIPTGEAAAIETLLETYLGAADDYSSPDVTTTTTTSTTSTSTTTTTTLIP